MRERDINSSARTKTCLYFIRLNTAPFLRLRIKRRTFCENLARNSFKSSIFGLFICFTVPPYTPIYCYHFTFVRLSRPSGIFPVFTRTIRLVENKCTHIGCMETCLRHLCTFFTRPIPEQNKKAQEIDSYGVT